MPHSNSSRFYRRGQEKPSRHHREISDEDITFEHFERAILEYLATTQLVPVRKHSKDTLPEATIAKQIRLYAMQHINTKTHPKITIQSFRQEDLVRLQTEIVGKIGKQYEPILRAVVTRLLDAARRES